MPPHGLVGLCGTRLSVADERITQAKSQSEAAASEDDLAIGSGSEGTHSRTRHWVTWGHEVRSRGVTRCHAVGSRGRQLELRGVT